MPADATTPSSQLKNSTSTAPESTAVRIGILTSGGDAQGWCDEHYANLDAGADRDAACAPVQLLRR